jgi:hypothetical protein
MKGLFKLILFVMSVLCVRSTCLYGAAEMGKTLHLIPISFNPETREYSILLRKPAGSRVFVPFTVTTRSLLNVDNVSEYMGAFSAQTFDLYRPNMVPRSLIKPAFTYEGKSVNEQSIEGLMFIEVPFIPGNMLFTKARNEHPSSDVDFVWISATQVSLLGDGQGSVTQAAATAPGFDIPYPIEARYLRALKLMLPTLQNIARQQKILHILPVSYDSSVREFSVLLIQPRGRGLYQAITSNFNPSALRDDLSTLCMRWISEETYGAYKPEVTRDVRIGRIFNATGGQVKDEDVEGYVYIKVPHIRGRDIWRAAQRYFGIDPVMNYNWVHVSDVRNTHELKDIPHLNGPMNSALLSVLKQTFHLLVLRGNELVIQEVTGQTGDCPVCLEPKVLEKLPCGHGVCAECLSQIEKKARVEQTDALCPMCRGKIAQ